MEQRRDSDRVFLWKCWWHGNEILVLRNVAHFPNPLRSIEISQLLVAFHKGNRKFSRIFCFSSHLDVGKWAARDPTFRNKWTFLRKLHLLYIENALRCFEENRRLIRRIFSRILSGNRVISDRSDNPFEKFFLDTLKATKSKLKLESFTFRCRFHFDRFIWTKLQEERKIGHFLSHQITFYENYESFALCHLRGKHR